MHSRARDSRHLVAKRLRSHAEVHIRIIRKELFIEFDLFEDFSSNKSISYEVEVRWPARSAHPGRPSCPHIYAAADEIRFASDTGIAEGRRYHNFLGAPDARRVSPPPQAPVWRRCPDKRRIYSHFAALLSYLC